MTDYNQQARAIVERSVTKAKIDNGEWFKITNLHVDLIDDIAQALELAATPKVISAEYLGEVAKGYADRTMYVEPEYDIARIGFEHGALYIANLNLMRALDEVFPDRELAKVKACDEGINAGFLACYDWLKETLRARLK